VVKVKPGDSGGGGKQKSRRSPDGVTGSGLAQVEVRLGNGRRVKPPTVQNASVVPALAGAIRVVRAVAGQAKNPKGANKPVVPRTPKGPNQRQVAAIRRANAAAAAAKSREDNSWFDTPAAVRKADAAMALKRGAGRGVSGKPARGVALGAAGKRREPAAAGAKRTKASTVPYGDRIIREATKAKSAPKGMTAKSITPRNPGAVSLSKGQRASAARYTAQARKKK